jgi:hypothetical protein
LKQASSDAQLCTDTRIISLMSTRNKGIDDDEDNKVLSSNNKEEDSSNSELSVEDDSDGEVTTLMVKSLRTKRTKKCPLTMRITTSIL